MVKLIIDTDIGSDCDDAGALAVACVLEKEKKSKIKAITHCLSRQSGPAAIDAILRYYNMDKSIKIGTLKKSGYVPKGIEFPYSNDIQNEFETSYPIESECSDAIKTLRQSLVECNDSEVVISAIGPLTDIRFLLESESDDISPLNGYDLVKTKVKYLCSMSGCFMDKKLWSDSPVDGEFNVVSDIESAKYVFNNCPVPIYCIPWETGAKIITGQNLMKTKNPLNPVYRSYELFCNGPRSSWDLCAVLFAVLPNEEYWEIGNAGKISVDDSGITIYNENQNGKHYIVSVNNNYKVKDVLNKYLVTEF